jgi:hypothetical protein
VICSIFCRTSRTTRIDLQRSSGACLKSRKDQIKRTAPTSSEETISIFCASLCNYKAHKHVTRTVARENSWGKNRAPGTIQPFCVSLCAKNFELSSHLFGGRPLLRTGCCGFFCQLLKGHHLTTCFGQPHVPAAFVANENIDLQIDVSSLYVCDILRM